MTEAFDPRQNIDVRVGVIIVNWNSFDILSKCLKALKAQTLQPWRTVVIDNGSDDAPPLLDGVMPENTAYVRQAQNVGFARANNIAAEMLDDCDWIALVNPDAFPEPDWLENLVDAAHRRPEFTFFASKTVIADLPEYLDGTGDVYHISGIGWRRGYQRHIASSRLAEEEIFAPCAAAALYRRDAWEEVGGFDEDYFCYFEDVDLAFRLRLMGYRCLFVPTAVAYHVGSVTSGGQQSDFSVYNGHRNLVWTYVKDMPGYAFWLFLPLHIAMNIITIGWFVMAGRSRVILRAKWDALKGIREAWRKRRTIQSVRKVSVGDVIRLMDKRMIPVRRPGKTLVGASGDLLPIYPARHRTGGTPPARDPDREYFDYLRSRGVVGYLYRNYWLYPRLSRNLSGRVLDVGCGIGDFLKFRPGTVGVDVNPYAVEWCRKLGLDARMMDPNRLPFEDASFDCVVLDNVLEHISDPSMIIREITRVLADKGCLLVGVPGVRGYACDPDHKVFYDETALDAVMTVAGFVKKKVFFTPFRSVWLDNNLPQYCLYGVYARC